MEIPVRQPVVAGIPLDDATEDVVVAGLALARRLGTSLLPVHALRPWPFPTARRTPAEARAARDRIVEVLRGQETGGVTVTEPIVEEATPASLLLDVADRAHAQMVVVGSRRGPTIGSWLLGTVADTVVRTARCPVLVARGSLPGPGRPIVCPVDLTPHSALGFEEALRMARLFEAPVRVVTVVPPADHPATLSDLERRATELTRAAETEVAALVRAHDTRDVSWQTQVVAGEPVAAILEAAGPAALVVLASRAFDMLVPASIGDIASRLMRNARCSVLCVRDLDPHPEERERQIASITDLRARARAALSSARADEALRLLRIAAARMPGHAPVVDDLATVLDRLGRGSDAERHRALARILRESHA